MMLEIWEELNSGKGPVQLKMTHLDEDTMRSRSVAPKQ